MERVAAEFRYNAEKLGMAVEREIFSRQLVRADEAVRFVLDSCKAGVETGAGEKLESVFQDREPRLRFILGA